MIKLVGVPNSVVGSGIVQYQLPESVKAATLLSAYMELNSVAVGSLDLSLSVSDKNFVAKTIAAIPNVGAGHAAISACMWGGTGAYYLAAQTIADYHHVPMQKLELEGGDRLTFIGIVDAAGFIANVAIWLDIEEFGF